MSDDEITILVVEDDPSMRAVLTARLADWGYGVRSAAMVEEAEAEIAQARPDLILSDVVMPGATGIDLVRRLNRGRVAIPVIIMTAHGRVDAAVEAMKAGARDFLTKPLDHDKLHAVIERLAAELRERRAARALDQALASEPPPGGLVGRSRSIAELRALVETLAASDASAIIRGESGTGKEVIARMVHALSGRRNAPFVAVNAAALPEGIVEGELFGHERGAFTGAVGARAGCFEQAAGGTLFLDEIAEMPVSLQPKLLRVLETRTVRRLGASREVPVDLRVLAATNRDPATAVREGRLREDLFYRLNVFEVEAPPLRERLEDVPLLAQHFIREFNQKHGMGVDGVSGEAAAHLASYAWPGNVRELRNVIERAVILARSDLVGAGHLPPYVRGGGESDDGVVVLPVGITAAEAERRLLLKTLECVGNNKAEAARRLGIDVKTVRNKLKAYRESAG